MGSLPNPPNFQGPGNQSPAPQSLSDWTVFWRWLFNLGNKANSSITAQQSITISPKPVHGGDQNTLGAAQVFGERQGSIPIPQGDRALIQVNVPESPPSIVQVDRAALQASIPEQASIPRSDQLTALIQMALAKPPYPLTNNNNYIWVYVGTHAQRIASHPASAYTNGTLFFETDRTLLYVADASQWVYVSGVMQTTQSALPTGLGAYDVNLLANVTDYNHLLQWNGTGWQWGPGENGSGFVQGFLVDPNPTTGWQLCDGSSASYLASNGSTASVTLPNVTGGGGSSAFLEFGTPASSTINAATAPTLAMNPYTPAGTNGAPAFTGNSLTPAGTNSAPTFAGSAMATHQHELPFSIPSAAQLMVANNPFGTGPNLTVFSYSGTGTIATGPQASALDSAVSAGTPAGTVSAPTFTGTPVTPTGTVAAPAFTGTAATLTGTISTTGKPANLVLRPWFRR